MNLRLFFLMICLSALANLQAQQLSGRYDAQSKTFESSDTNYTCDFFRNGFAQLYRDGLVGLMDSSGRILIAPRYDKISNFEKGCAKAYTNGRCGIIDKNGKEILAPDSVILSDFVEGYARFKDLKTELYGLISDSGKIILPAKYKVLHEFREGMTFFLRNSTFGLMTENGTEIIWDREFSLDNHPEIVISAGTLQHRRGSGPIFQFYSGRAMFFIQKGDELLFGYMDKSGKTLIEPKYSMGETFRSDGTALVQYKGNWGKIDTIGNLLEPFKYESQEALRRKIAGATAPKPLKPKSKAVQPTILPQKEEVYKLFGNYYIASNGHKWAVIDEARKPLTKYKYDAIIAIDSNTAILSSYVDAYSLNTGIPRYMYLGSYQYMNTKGEIAKKEVRFSKVIQGVSDFHHDEFILKNPSAYAPELPHWGNNLVTHYKFSGPNALHDIEETIFEGYRIISLDTDPKGKNKQIDMEWDAAPQYKKAVIDGSGKTIIPVEYDEIKSDGTPLLIVSKNVKDTTQGLYKGAFRQYSGVVDIHNKVIIPMEYAYIEHFSAAFLVTRTVGVYDPSNPKFEQAIFDLNGKIIIPFSSTYYMPNVLGQWLEQKSGNYKAISRGRS